MISIFLQGGLGNQLFQIAAVIAYCIEHNEKCIFTYDETLTLGVERKTYWNTLLKKCKELTNINSKKVTNEHLQCLPKFMELDFTYNEIHRFHYDVMLVGYYQSYKYFHSVQEEVFDIMGLRDEQAIIQEYLISYKNTICMHFRLGDYKQKQDYHLVLPYEYYENALRSLSEDFLKDSTIYYLCEEEENEVVSSMVCKLQKSFELSNATVKVDDTMTDCQQM